MLDIKHGTLVIQKRQKEAPWNLLDKDSDFELASTDFSNIDNPQEQLVVLRNCKDNSKPTFVYRCDNDGQMAIETIY